MQFFTKLKKSHLEGNCSVLRFQPLVLRALDNLKMSKTLDPRATTETSGRPKTNSPSTSRHLSVGKKNYELNLHHAGQQSGERTVQRRYTESAFQMNYKALVTDAGPDRCLYTELGGLYTNVLFLSQWKNIFALYHN